MRPSTSAGPATEGGGPRNDEYRERYMRMRNEYRGLLRSRTDSIRKSGRISAEKEQGVLIEQVRAAAAERLRAHHLSSLLAVPLASARRPLSRPLVGGGAVCRSSTRH